MVVLFIIGMVQVKIEESILSYNVEYKGGKGKWQSFVRNVEHH